MEWQLAVLWALLAFAGVASLACSVALGIEAWRFEIGRKAVRRDARMKIEMESNKTEARR